MNARIVLVMSMSLIACDRGLADRQAELAATIRDEAARGAQLNSFSRQLTETKNRTMSEENRATGSLKLLRDYQVRMVESWKGDPAKLAEWKKAAKTLPPELASALDLAQSVAGGDALERKFVRAIESDKPEDVGKLLEWWENGWVDSFEPEVADEAAPRVCPTNRSLSCTPIDDDSLWCPDAEQGASWAMLLENGTLTVARLTGGQSHTVEARLAPRVWLTRVGTGDRGFMVLHAVKGPVFSTQWQMRIENEKAKRPIESLKANFDADPFIEALFWDDEELSWLDPTSRDDVTILKNLQACEALEVIEGIPSPVRERCHKLRAPPPMVDAGN